MYIDINEPGDPNFRHIPASRYDLSWNYAHKTCYYVGNSQGGPELSRSASESVIEGSYKEYQTGGLFDPVFKYNVFEDVC